MVTRKSHLWYLLQRASFTLVASQLVKYVILHFPQITVIILKADNTFRFSAPTRQFITLQGHSQGKVPKCGVGKELLCSKLTCSVLHCATSQVVGGKTKVQFNT